MQVGWLDGRMDDYHDYYERDKRSLWGERERQKLTEKKDKKASLPAFWRDTAAQRSI